MKMFVKIFKYDFIYLIKRVWLYYPILFVSTGFTRLFIFLSESNVNSGALLFITVSSIVVLSLAISSHSSLANTQIITERRRYAQPEISIPDLVLFSNSSLFLLIYLI